MRVNILNLIVGKTYALREIWDGDGDAPTETYAYPTVLGPVEEWVIYRFEFINPADKENLEKGLINRPESLELPVKLTSIERV